MYQGNYENDMGQGNPEGNGWYWIKYRGRHGITKCPAMLSRLLDGTVMLSAAINVNWIAGPHHGGPELKCFQGDKFEADKSIRFGPFIPVPE